VAEGHRGLPQNGPGGPPVRRDIARALRLIGEGHAKVAADGAVTLRSPDASTLKVPAAAVAAMVSEGLIIRVRDEVRRTSAGRSFLRRALATGEEDGFAAQHRDMAPQVVDVAGQSVKVAVNSAENPLLWLSTRKGRDGAPLIDHTQLKAGQRLAADHERGHLRERVTQGWDASGVRGAARRDRLTASEAAVAARRRVEAALDAVGPGLSHILVAVCCEEIGLEAAEKRLGWPARSAKVVLRLALDRLAQHYGLGEAAIGHGSGLVHWGAEGYRPRA